MSRTVYLFIVAVLVLIPAAPLGAQVPEAAAGADLQDRLVRVFLDCQTRGCDFDFFRTEIDFVSWVRDRNAADVHVLVTGQQTGGGGERFELAFLGLGAFSGISDTLNISTRQTDTDDEERRSLARVLKLGLLPYVRESAAGAGIEIEYNAPDVLAGEGELAGMIDDPWNFWVFNAGVRTEMEGESTSDSQQFSGSLSANRTTADWKIELETEGSYEENNYEVRDSTITSLRRSYGAEGLVVRSLGPLFSAGLKTSMESSTYFNKDLGFRVAPVVEYSIYPYSESTRRQFTIQYTVGFNTFDYIEETIFEKMEEQVFDHSLTAELDLRQPWGSIRGQVSGAQYLHDFSKRRLTFDGNLDFRLWRGLSLDVRAGYSRISDQLYLIRGEASDEEILLELRQLETDYRYDMSIGLNYRFGSIFNNVVNPRIGGFDRFR